MASLTTARNKEKPGWTGESQSSFFYLHGANGIFQCSGVTLRKHPRLRTYEELDNNTERPIQDFSSRQGVPSKIVNP
jgi:hypothetical protein